MATITRPSSRNKSVHGRSAAKTSAAPANKSLFSKSAKALGPRTYSSHLKQLPNGNHLLVITDSKRDPDGGQSRKTRLFVHGEDFLTFFRMLHETATFIRANPVPEEIKQSRERHWARAARDRS